jgi:hypothetical protein
MRVAVCVFGNRLIPLAVAKIILPKNSLSIIFFFTTLENVYFAKLQYVVVGVLKTAF